MRKEVEQLALMGAMPDEADERTTTALVDEYADLLDKIKAYRLGRSAYFNQALSAYCFIWHRMDIATFNRVSVFRNRISSIQKTYK